MLDFVPINKDNWPALRKHIIHSELSFPCKIRTDHKEYYEIISKKNAVGIAAFNNGNYAGNAVGYRLSKRILCYHLGLEELECPSKSVYLFSFVLEKASRGKGYGEELFIEFLNRCRKKGYSQVFGHYRKNGSLAIAKKHGGKEERQFMDWEETGEDYVLCRIELKEPSSHEENNPGAAGISSFRPNIGTASIEEGAPKYPA